MSPTTRTDHLAEEELAAYADDELDPREKEQAAAHLEECERCSAALTELLEYRSALNRLPRASPPDSFAGTVEGRIRRRSRGRFFAVGWQSNRMVYLYAAIVLVILIALYVFSQVALEVRDARTGLPGDEISTPGASEDNGNGP